MAATPEQVRASLTVVAAEAAAEVQAASREAGTPEGLRTVLFAVAPLIFTDYTAGSSALAVDWYEELREEATPRRLFTPTVVPGLSDDLVRASVARATDDLRDLTRAFEADLEALAAEVVRDLEDEVQKAVADAFRDTVTENAASDPDAAGWRRFARPEACKFCLMLAAKGAVYTEATARFAAHGAVMADGRKGGNCMCIASPAFGGKEIWAEATPMQYLASRRTRTPEQRAVLRTYLNENFPDAPG